MSGEYDVFKWTNFDGNGNDCYFEGQVFTAGGCLQSGLCPNTAGQFNEVTP